MHGIIIHFTDPLGRGSYKATYLPEVAQGQGWTREECVDSVMLKAGYRGKITPKLRESLSLTRYQSCPFGMYHDECIPWKGAVLAQIQIRNALGEWGAGSGERTPSMRQMLLKESCAFPKGFVQYGFMLLE